MPEEGPIAVLRHRIFAVFRVPERNLHRAFLHRASNPPDAIARRILPEAVPGCVLFVRFIPDHFPNGARVRGEVARRTLLGRVVSRSSETSAAPPPPSNGSARGSLGGDGRSSLGRVPRVRRRRPADDVPLATLPPREDAESSKRDPRGGARSSPFAPPRSAPFPSRRPSRASRGIGLVMRRPLEPSYRYPLSRNHRPLWPHSQRHSERSPG